MIEYGAPSGASSHPRQAGTHSTSSQTTKQTDNTMTENQHRQPYPYDDEISLVDLALILIKRRWWVIGIGVLVVGLAFVFALINRGEPSYQMVTIYETAQYTDETGREQPTQSINGLIQRLQTVHWPELRRTYVAERTDLDEMPFELEVSNPSNTSLLSLVTPAVASNQDEVERIHRSLLEPIIDTQTREFENRQRILQSQMDRIQTRLEQAETADSGLPPELFAQYSDQLMELEARLESLREGSVIQTAARGDRASDGPGGALILALGIVLGGILGLMAGFFAEFGARVRQAMKEQKDQA